MLEVKQRAKNIEELSKIVTEMENNDSFNELRNDLKEFKEEFIKQLQNEKKMKDIQQSKILNDLKNIRKN
jgi:tellurite resistance protein